MKKLLYLLLLIPLILILTAGSKREKLLLLNWGEYINDEAVALFEQEYNIDVIIDIADSNEIFYSKLKSGTTAYDLCIPSEYMVDRMYKNDLLQSIDKTRLTDYDKIDFMPGVIGISDSMFEEFKDYSVPYLWGTFGLMYNKNKVGLEAAVKELGWKALFENDTRLAGIKKGMYDVPRFSYAAALFYNDKDKNPNLDTDEALKAAQDALSKVDFTEWGTDILKKDIAANNLDLAFVYTGDHLDMLYTKLETTKLEDIKFDIYIPDDTIAFMDSFVIPKKARHLDAAYKFMDFFLRPEMARLNADVVGYCTPLVESYNMIVNPNDNLDDLIKDGLTKDEAEELIAFHQSQAYAYKKYYPLPNPEDEKQYIGTALQDLNKKFLKRINIMINNIKATK